MHPPDNFMQINLIIELVHTLIILIFCSLIYFKTKEAYQLTKHKGIQFFRYSFLFFGLAYASRLFLHIFLIGQTIIFEPLIKHQGIMLMPVFNLIIAYFSTMAILYLTYSTVWKKFSMDHFITFSNIIAILIAALAFIYRSHIIISITQLLLLVITSIISIQKYQKRKKKTHTRSLYLLISVFWLINLFIVGPKKFLSFEIKLALELISIGIFFLIYYKVKKWIK